ncbi:uncharacterized protein C9orf85 homolog [Lineus longissimus]|uniref:uncharacterized protein C9orf85 homolog n=1 Tax=Lineus longissimus TaxID=88925 RepID=UPI002B4E8B2C
MSSKKGNVKKTGPPKYQNKTAFKNNLHDTSIQTKRINSLEVTGACQRCKEVIEWKIKYKKYKPLSVPKKCVRCNEKAIKKAYCVVCDACAAKHEVCIKCNKAENIVQKPGLSPEEEARQQSLLEQEIRMMSERKRRTFFRLQESGKLKDAAELEGDDGDDDSDVEESDNEKDIDTMDTRDGQGS